MVRLKELRVPQSEVVRSPDPGLPADLRRGLEQFQRGVVALAIHRPEEYQHLAAWQGKESELVSLVFQKARGEDVLLPEETYAAALKAGKVGLVLQKEEMAKAAYVTEEPEKQFGADLRKIAARMDALGVNTPFTKGILTGSTSIEIRRGIEACRKLGLLDEGQAWAFQAGKIRELAQVIGKRFDRDKDGSDSLLDNRFIQGRHM
jgi:hypothetical protein